MYFWIWCVQFLAILPWLNHRQRPAPILTKTGSSLKNKCHRDFDVRFYFVFKLKYGIWIWLWYIWCWCNGIESSSCTNGSGMNRKRMNLFLRIRIDAFCLIHISRDSQNEEQTPMMMKTKSMMIPCWIIAVSRMKFFVQITKHLWASFLLLLRLVNGE